MIYYISDESSLKRSVLAGGFITSNFYIKLLCYRHPRSVTLYPDGGLERFEQLLERAERRELLRHGQHQLGRVVVVRLRGGGEQGRVGEVAADRHVDGAVQQQPERPVRRAVRVDAAPGPPVRRLHDRDAKVEVRGQQLHQIALDAGQLRGGGGRPVPSRPVHKLQEGGPLERRWILFEWNGMGKLRSFPFLRHVLGSKFYSGLC